MSASQSGTFNVQQFTDLGAPLAGGRLYTYVQGTTTQKTAYTDHAGTTPHTYTSDGIGGQYIALNARGELPAPLYLAAGSYDLALKTAAGATVWTRRADPVWDITSDLTASTGSSLVGFIQSGTGAVAGTVQDALRALNPLMGTDLTGVIDATAIIQAGLDAHGYVFLPEGIFKFSSLTASKRGCLIKGAGQRTVLIHTGAAAAITCLDSTTTIYPGGAPAYVNDGQFTFSDFMLYTNGPIGFDFGKNRTTGSSLERVYMKPYAYYAALTNSTYVAGTTAISCDNTPYGTTSATYGITVRQCWIAGYENIAKLDQSVNFWNFDRIYGIDNLRFLDLARTTGTNPGTTGIHITNSYFESGVASARGVVFGVGGGNNIGISNTTFELTNVAATQYAYDFSAGGTWTQINVVNCKYLLVGDGNAVNGKRIIGTAPAQFVELGRSYTNTVLATDVPMLWAPGVSASAPFQQPNFSKFGGPNMGNGRAIFSRSGSDASDGYIANDGAYGLTFTAPGYGGTVDFLWQDAASTGLLRFRNYTTPGFYTISDNVYPCGQASNRWSVIYAGTGAINTSDARQKQQGRSLSDAEKAVALKIKSSLKAFRFNDAVEKKGDAARWHFGVYAQEVADAFRSEGLDPNAYALFCYDKWDDSFDNICDADGNPTGDKKLVTPAGDRYGIRYEELLAFMIGAM